MAALLNDGGEAAGPTVLVVDDHPLWRDALARDLAEDGCPVVAVAAGAGEALAQARRHRPAVVLLDLQLPDRHGTEVVAGLVELGCRVLVVSASGEVPDVMAALREGAVGYLTKSATTAELRSAVRSAAAGVPTLSPEVAGLVLGELRRPVEPGSTLTERETEVLRLVALGLTSKQIAARLFLSHRTVENHTASVLAKLHLANRVQLTRYAVEHGLAEPDMP